MRKSFADLDPVTRSLVGAQAWLHLAKEEGTPLPAYLEVWIAGGFVRDAQALNAEGAKAGPVGDIDLFVLRKSHLASLCRWLLDQGGRLVRRRGNVSSYVMPSGMAVQAIYVKAYTAIEDLLGEFDFRCNAAAVRLEKAIVPAGVAAAGFAEDVASRTLTLFAPEYANVRRVVAFAVKGYAVSEDLLITMSKLNRPVNDIFFGGAFTSDYEDDL